jgi:hypothetical protein
MGIHAGIWIDCGTAHATSTMENLISAIVAASTPFFARKDHSISSFIALLNRARTGTFDNFAVNAVGYLESTGKHAPGQRGRRVVLLSMNKLYGDALNEIPKTCCSHKDASRCKNDNLCRYALPISNHKTSRLTIHRGRLQSLVWIQWLIAESQREIQTVWIDGTLSDRGLSKMGRVLVVRG